MDMTTEMKPMDKLIACFNRLNDAFFKFLFAMEAWKYLLVELVNEVIADAKLGLETLPKVLNLSYVDRESTPTHQGDKAPRFDVVARLSGGSLLLFEAQLVRDRKLLPRILHYAAHLYKLLTERGQEYSGAHVIVVVIVDFALFKGRQAYHRVHRILDAATGEWDLQGLEFHFIEMPKVRRLCKGRAPETGLENFLYYFGNIGGNEMVQAIAEKDWRVAKMLELEEQFQEDPLQMVAYELAEQAHRDFELECQRRETRGEKRGERRGEKRGIKLGEERGIKLGEERGIKLGKELGIKLGEERGIKLGEERGIKLGKVATAQRLRAMGLSDEQIAQGTGLSLDEIEAL